jgi:predicted amino acid-binding ACT domain protein
MKIFDKILNFFKKSSIVTIEENTKLYDEIKTKMDDFEKNVIIDTNKMIVVAIKQLISENQMLKDAIANQNRVLSTLVSINQNVVTILNSAISSQTVDIDMLVDDSEEDISESAVEKKLRENLKKHGVN